MDVSFIFSADELLTLTSQIPGATEAGRLFCAEALSRAEVCGLNGLVEKKMAKYIANGDMELTPVVRMLTEAMARPEKIEWIENGWIVRSPWIAFKCEKYPYKENHYAITPMKEE